MVVFPDKADLTVPIRLKNIFLTLTVSLLTVFAAAGGSSAVEIPEEAAEPSSGSADTLRVSVLTCYPGEEVYELYGHTGLRIRSSRFDSVWNYGVFDFHQPNFILRFSLGETDYMVVGEQFEQFIYPYRIQSRAVVEQELNLTQSEAGHLLSLMRENALPENRVYRYNYLNDNCATRVFDQIVLSTKDSILINTPRRYASYRKAMKAYHGASKWYNLGIDIALGSDVDKPITAREQLFIPLELYHALSEMTLGDGRKLVKNTSVLFGEENKYEKKHTSDTCSPMFWFSILNFICAGCCMWYLYRRKINRVVYTLAYSVIGIGGLFVFYLTFVSSHPATSPNYLLVWLNPIGLIVPACIWVKGNKMRWIMYSYMVANSVGILVFLLLWPVFHQFINYSLLPLVVADMMFSVTYILIYFNEFFQKFQKSAPDSCPYKKK